MPSDEEGTERTAQEHSMVTSKKYKIAVDGIADGAAVKMELSED